MSESSDDKYNTEVLRKLEGFKNAKEWSDFIGLLDSLCVIFKKHRKDYIPCLPQLVKRLNQMLNPALPGGVHLKTFECYTTILDLISEDNLLRDFDVFTVGLFNFSLNYKVAVAVEYLDLLEIIVEQLQEKIKPFSQHVIVGFLPFLESESSDFFDRAYGLLVRFLGFVDEDMFFRSIWKVFISLPEMRACTLNFFSRHKIVVIPDYCLVNTALCIGMESSNPYIIRSLLDISHRDFPMITELKEDGIDDAKIEKANTNDFSKEADGPMESNTLRAENQKRVLRSPSLENLAVSNSIISPAELNKSVTENFDRSFLDLDEKSLLDNVGLYKSANSSSKDISSEGALSIAQPKSQQVIKDLVLVNSEIRNDLEVRNQIVVEAEDLNRKLIKNVLKIFLMKEVGINKRAYKWFNLGEIVTDKDIDYIERGLREYLLGCDDDLITFYEILNSLSYRDNLCIFLIDRIVIDSFKVLKQMDSLYSKEKMVALKKKAKIFISSSLDEIYRVLYTNLDQIFSKLENKNSNTKASRFELNNLSSLSLSTTNQMLAPANETNEAEDFVELIIFLIEDLGATDQNVIDIHLPLLCHSIIRNRFKISDLLFDYFIGLFLEHSEPTLDSAANKPGSGTSVSPSLIKSFYQKENTKELLEINLISAVAKELGRIDIYKESYEDNSYWSNSELILKDGVLEWAEVKDAFTFKGRPNKEQIFNFSGQDIMLINKFIRKFGFKDFEADFLAQLGNFLCHNYKFIELVNSLRFYINSSLLNINLWNDFLISKNPKFLLFYGEDQLLPFLHDIIQTACLKDICIFLKEALAQGKFVEILFKVSATADTQSNYFIDLLVNIKNPIPVLHFLLEKFYNEDEDDSCADLHSKFNIIYPILLFIEGSFENDDFIKILELNPIIEISKFGKINIMEALISMLSSIIVEKQKSFSGEESYLKDSDDANSSFLIEYAPLMDKNENLKIEEIKIENIKIESSTSNANLESGQRENDAADVKDEESIASVESEVLKGMVIPYSDESLGFENSQKLASKNSYYTLLVKIHKMSFNILFLFHKNSLSVNLPSLTAVKSVIKKYRDNHYILKRSLFLVASEPEFILENYMHFYKLILADINTMPTKNQFFAHVIKPNTKSTVEIILEAFEYYGDFSGFRIEDFFDKAVFLMIQHCKKICSIYKHYKGFYHKISNQALFDFSNNNSKYLLNESSSTEKYKNVDHLFKTKISKEDLESLVGRDVDSESIVLLYSGDLAPVIALGTKLYRMNPSILVSSIPDSMESLFVFGALPFKCDILCKLLCNARNPRYSLKFLKIFVQSLPISKRKDIIRAEAIYLKNNFGFIDMDIASISFVLELFKHQNHSDLSRLIFLNILRTFEKKIASLQFNETNLDDELKILKKISKLEISDTAILIALKNCLFELLDSRKYQDDVLVLIYNYFVANPNCKIFIDAFVQYFGKNFFGFGLDLKKKIFETISSSNNFDCFVLMENIMSGMDSSFFMSAQSEEIQKINSLKKMAFLIFSQPINKFSTKSDVFVTMINNNINLGVEIKIEVFKLCSTLILRIDHSHIQTLFPIMLGEFLTNIQSKNLRLATEMLRLIDLSTWLNSPIFNFKVLFLENHNFHKQIESLFSSSDVFEFQIDYKSKKMPNLLSEILQVSVRWAELHAYFSVADEYYNYMLDHLSLKDYDKVESYFTNIFLENKTK